MKKNKKIAYLLLSFVMIGSLPLCAMERDIPYREMRRGQQMRAKRCLREAARRGTFDEVRTLVERGVPFDVPDSYDDTALSVAREKGRTEIVEFLQNWEEEPSPESPEQPLR